MCYKDYITFSRYNPSRSGLYASDLVGFDELSLDLLGKDAECIDDTWDRLYSNAWRNLVSDVQVFLNQKFFVNQKLVTRQTGEFTEGVSSDSKIIITLNLSMYSVFHIIKLDVKSESDQGVIDFSINSYELSQEINQGLNSIYIDKDFTGEEIVISHNGEFVNVLEKVYKGGNGLSPSIELVNGGVGNLFYDIYCSPELFVCKNLNLFAKIFQWRIGLEWAIERKYSSRNNQYTVMTTERQDEFVGLFNRNYQSNLRGLFDSLRINEDRVCFQCGTDVYSKILIP